MPRNFWRCEGCRFRMVWGFTATVEGPLPNPYWLDDADPGFVIMLHIKQRHPDWVDGPKLLRLEDIVAGRR